MFVSVLKSSVYTQPETAPHLPFGVWEVTLQGLCWQSWKRCSNLLVKTVGLSPLGQPEEDQRLPGVGWGGIVFFHPDPTEDFNKPR